MLADRGRGGVTSSLSWSSSSLLLLLLLLFDLNRDSFEDRDEVRTRGMNDMVSRRWFVRDREDREEEVGEKNKGKMRTVSKTLRNPLPSLPILSGFEELQL